MPKKGTPEVYTEPWKWSFPKIKLTFPRFNLRKVISFLFRDWAKGIRRLSIILLVFLYVPVINLLGLGEHALDTVPDQMISVTEPQSIQGEEQQFLIAHIANNVFFRVIGATKYWRIFHECQNHVVTDLSGAVVRSECQHPDNWVNTTESEWHRYSLRYDEEIRVVYSPGAQIELRVVTEPTGRTPISVTIYRFLYLVLFAAVYIFLNIDADIIPKRFLS
jgi:hypothetical protein